jgi:hypothetical protein
VIAAGEQIELVELGGRLRVEVHGLESQSSTIDVVDPYAPVDRAHRRRHKKPIVRDSETAEGVEYRVPGPAEDDRALSEGYLR